MKQYPKIPVKTEVFEAHVFDKLDGSNIRVEYSPKQGFYKFGSRTLLLDVNHIYLGGAVTLFRETWEDKLLQVIQDKKLGWPTFFFEYYGPKSLGGVHELDDPKTLTLIDVWIKKQGLLEPTLFLKYFEGLDIPKYLGKHRWTEAFKERVKYRELEGITFEGVVGKAGPGNKHIMAKAKTLDWILAIKERYLDTKDFDF